MCCGAFIVIVLSYEPRQNLGQGLVDRNSFKLPSNFIAGRPKVALLFCFVLFFFGDFRCGVPLFIVILVIYKSNIGKDRY